jgi:D-glucosaminate-specific PTS system IIB component
MTNVTLVRIDDRLIHGQVVVKWLRYLPCKEILIVDDNLWRDEFMQDVLRLAAPPDVRVNVAPVREAARRLGASVYNANQADEAAVDRSAGALLAPGSANGRAVDSLGGAADNGHGVMVLVRSPQTALALLDHGFRFTELNVGGLAASEGATRLYKSVSATGEQIAALRTIQDRGVRVYFQTVPEERSVGMSELLAARQPQQEEPAR